MLKGGGQESVRPVNVELETASTVTADNRRRHRRLEIRMPIELTGRDERSLVRTVTRNIGTGGFYVELDRCDFAPGEQLRVDMTVPAGEGVSPYPSRAQCTGEVLRIDRIRSTAGGPARVGVAVRFLDRLRFNV